MISGSYISYNSYIFGSQMFSFMKLQFGAPQARQLFAVRKNLSYRNKAATPVARFLRTATAEGGFYAN